MNNVNKTLYIPLHGKAYVSKKKLFLDDKTAEEIWNAEGFSLKGRAKSKYLAYYMGIRSAVFDNWLSQQISTNEDAVVIHIGCGLDSRVKRVNAKNKWYDIDFPQVIAERKRYFCEEACYKMLEADVRENNWITSVSENKKAIVVMEGVSMYLALDELCGLMENICAHFESVKLLMDCYTVFAAKMSKYKNPINEVGVTKAYGIDNPRIMEQFGLTFLKEHTMIPQEKINELKGIEKLIFAKLYAGGISKKLYRLFEYSK